MVRYAALQCCYKLKRSSQEPVSSYVWISNEVLQAQWTRFSSSTTMRSRAPSRRHMSGIQAHAQNHNIVQCRIRPTTRSKGDSDVSFLQKRNGSAVPGPLEARKRRALRKHITGASHSDIFGAGLEFDGSSLRRGIDQAGENMKSRLESVYDSSNALATTVDEVWKWWSTYSDVLAKKKENTLLLPMETPVSRSSFEALLAELDLSWMKVPENIHELLQRVLRLEISNQEKMIQQICSWVRAEVALGSMHETDVKSMLGEVDYSIRSSYDHVKLESLTHICEAIGHGIASSIIRPAKDFDSDTIWLLIRSLVGLSTKEHTFTFTLSHLLQSLASTRRDECTQLIRGLIGTTQFTFGVRKSGVLKILGVLPPDISSAAILGLCERLVDHSCTGSFQLRSRYLLQAKNLLIEFSNHNLLADVHDQQKLGELWLRLEHNLSGMGMLYIVTYLQTADEAKVCSFILKHVVGDFRYAAMKGDRTASAATLLEKDAKLSSYNHTYADLLQSVMAQWPHKTRSVVRFLYSFFRESGRAEECYNVSRYVFSKDGRGLRPSVEFLHSEISQWAKANPFFAVLLLATDPRHASSHHPVLTRAIIDWSQEMKALPAKVAPTIAKMTIKRYGPDLDIRDPASKAPMAASSLLQLLLQPLVWGDLPEREAFRLFRKILSTLSPVAHTLKKGTSIAAINLVAIKSLNNRQRIPRRRMEWLGRVVTCLEGPQTWSRTADRLEYWWSMIEAENVSERVKVDAEQKPR